jgi:hypothetical protein
MGKIKPEIARIYPAKYHIRFDDLKETGFRYEYLSVAGYFLPYILHDTKITINSGIQNDQLENVHFMEARVGPNRLLNIGLVTWEKECGYFPLFYAQGFLNMVLSHFSGRFDGIEADWYKKPGKDQIFNEFFEKYSREKSPEEVAMQTKTGKWLIDKGFKSVVPDKANIYEEALCDELKFIFYR